MSFDQMEAWRRGRRRTEGSGGGGGGGGDGGGGGPVDVVSTLRAPETFSTTGWTADELTWYQRIKDGWIYQTNETRVSDDLLADSQLWDDSYYNNDTWTLESKVIDGQTFTWRQFRGPLIAGKRRKILGQYSIVRGMAVLSYGIVGAGFRAAKDLYMLSIAAIDVDHNMRQAKDTGGVSTSVPDGYLGWVQGTDGQGRVFYAPDDVRNTRVLRSVTINGVKTERPLAINEDTGSTNIQRYTGVEHRLQDAITPGFMVTILGCWQNRDRFCPIHEPVGNRPLVPAYYDGVWRRGVKVYEDTLNKYIDHDEATGVPNIRKQLPLEIKDDLMHPVLGEIVGKICYAKIMGGLNYMTHPAYLQAARALAMVLGDTEKPGNTVGLPNNKCSWYEHTHADGTVSAIMNHRAKRLAPSSTKDATGEYIPANTGAGPHLTTYCGLTFGALAFIRAEAPELMPLTKIQRFANGCAKGMIGHGKSSIGTDLTQYMHGDGSVPVPANWSNNQTGEKQSRALFNSQDHGILAPYETTPTGTVIQEYTTQAWANHGGNRRYGAACVQLFNFAVRAGRIAP